MDELHSLEENFNKVEALITSINIIWNQRETLSDASLQHEIDSLKVLSDEASESLETLRNTCAIIKSKV